MIYAECLPLHIFYHSWYRCYPLRCAQIHLDTNSVLFWISLPRLHGFFILCVFCYCTSLFGSPPPTTMPCLCIKFRFPNPSPVPVCNSTSSTSLSCFYPESRSRFIHNLYPAHLRLFILRFTLISFYATTCFMLCFFSYDRYYYVLGACLV
jgi:hypothetical protein